MQRRLIECVPNFSFGRNQELLDTLSKAVAGVAGAALLRSERDADHNRSVLTMAGAPEPVMEAALRCVACAIPLIDLRRQQGVHPRIGAVDVIPLVPLENVSMEECAALAHTLGKRIWEEHSVPVYFYERAAFRVDRQRLEVIRKGGFESLLTDAVADPLRAPDLGGPALHPSAGAVAVGARQILVAFNINLDTADAGIASAIARRIRTSSGGLPCVKALGVYLESRGRAQVTMNLTDYRQTPPAVVFEAVSREASSLGVSIYSSEIIGLAPRAAFPPGSEEKFRIENFRAGLILEEQLEAHFPAG